MLSLEVGVAGENCALLKCRLSVRTELSYQSTLFDTNSTGDRIVSGILYHRLFLGESLCSMTNALTLMF